MVSFALVDELAEALKSELRDLYFEDAFGERTKLKIYKQNLSPQSEDTDFSPFPYVTLKLLSGVAPVDERANNGESIRLLILVGTINREKSGDAACRDLVGIIQRIKEFLQRKGAIKHFILSDDIEWAIHEEDEWPYAFGGVDTKWKTRTIRREDRLI